MTVRASTSLRIRLDERVRRSPVTLCSCSMCLQPPRSGNAVILSGSLVMYTRFLNENTVNFADRAAYLQSRNRRSHRAIGGMIAAEAAARAYDFFRRSNQ